MHFLSTKSHHIKWKIVNLTQFILSIMRCITHCVGSVQSLWLFKHITHSCLCSLGSSVNLCSSDNTEQAYDILSFPFLQVQKLYISNERGHTHTHTHTHAHTHARAHTHTHTEQNQDRSTDIIHDFYRHLNDRKQIFHVIEKSIARFPNDIAE
jgi:hypothetical protein